MTNLGASLLEQLLAADTGRQGQHIDCECGHQAEFVSNRPKSVDTVLGPISLNRAYYHCSKCHSGVVPKDDQLGVAGVSLSPGLRAMVDRVAVTAPFAKAADLLAELAGVTLSTKRVERRAEADGTTLVDLGDREAAAVANGTLVPLHGVETVDKLYIVVDGTGVPMVPAEVAERSGKQADGRAHTREVKLAVLFTQTKLDDEGRPVRDAGSSSYLATFEAADHFGSLVYAEARRRGSDHAKQLVVLGDGAPWIWNLAAEHFPTATQIVDFYHAREHLYALGALAAPALGERHTSWLAQRLAELDRGDIETLLRCGADLNLSSAVAVEVEKALGYFERNTERMRYQKFRQLGHFVGSGAVESGCKAVIGQRLKLSGMRWTVRGAASVVTLRCHQASGRWEEIWQRLGSQTSVA